MQEWVIQMSSIPINSGFCGVFSIRIKKNCYSMHMCEPLHTTLTYTWRRLYTSPLSTAAVALGIDSSRGYVAAFARALAITPPFALRRCACDGSSGRDTPTELETVFVSPRV